MASKQIKKVTSGSTPAIGDIVNDLYGSIITAGTHLAPTIKVAEAAKVIENAQRDINIAFVNELAKIEREVLDPIACLEVDGGYIILHAWDEEAHIPEIKNDILN